MSGKKILFVVAQIIRYSYNNTLQSRIQIMQHYRQPIEKEILDEKNPFHKRSFQWRSFLDLEPLSVAMVT